MKSQIITVQLRRPKSREQMKIERRWRIADNIVTVLLGLASASALFWAGWLVGSGAFAL